MGHSCRGCDLKGSGRVDDQSGRNGFSIWKSGIPKLFLHCLWATRSLETKSFRLIYTEIQLEFDSVRIDQEDLSDFRFVDIGCFERISCGIQLIAGLFKPLSLKRNMIHRILDAFRNSLTDHQMNYRPFSGIEPGSGNIKSWSESLLKIKHLRVKPERFLPL